ncbi:MAG: hemerythrin domain-containing protein [Thermoplasmata archaeon]|nr:hemerythrin domain-containing protein [Thermoplasmata archaeon]
MPVPRQSATMMLSEEHQNILKVIRALEIECDHLRGGGELDKDFFGRAIDFIKNYADGFHHSKEEDILFVKMCDDTVQLHCNPTVQMLHEHDTGRQYVKGLEEALEVDDVPGVIENAMGYALLLQDHIHKEDNILYPMAEQALDAETKRSMLDTFYRVQDEKFPEGTKERYEAMALEFEERSKNG